MRRSYFTPTLLRFLRKRSELKHVKRVTLQFCATPTTFLSPATEVVASHFHSRLRDTGPTSALRAFFFKSPHPPGATVPRTGTRRLRHTAARPALPPSARLSAQPQCGPEARPLLPCRRPAEAGMLEWGRAAMDR